MQGCVHIVDDDAAFATAMERRLTHAGYGVATHASAQHLLDHLPSEVSFREIIPSGAPLGRYESAFASLPALPLRVLQKEILVPLREGLPEKKAACSATSS